MKSFVCALCFIIPLIIIFIIIDRRDFYSGDNISVKDERKIYSQPVRLFQSESNPLANQNKQQRSVETTTESEKSITKSESVETKSVADLKAKPKTEMLSVKTMPIAETTTIKNKTIVEAKSLTETKKEPAQMKPAKGIVPSAVDKTAAQTVPAAETILEAPPAAVPFVTEEKAELLNMIAALLMSEKTSIVEGEIIARSILPNPSDTDYSDCRFTAHFCANSIISGIPCPQELVLVIEGFIDKGILEDNIVEVGDKISCTLIPYSLLPDKVQSVQQSDDLQLYLLENYYALSIKKIKSYSDKGMFSASGIPFSDESGDYVSIFERHINPPVLEETKNNQLNNIQKTLNEMERLLEKFNDKKMTEINKSFDVAWEKEKKKDPTGYNRVKIDNGEYVWRRIDNSFWCLPVNYKFLSKPKYLSDEVLDCFVSFKEALEANGVQLIVSLVPDLFVISSRIINPEFKSVPDIQTAIYVKQLSEKGIETIYASDMIIKNYNRYPFAFFFPRDGHPSETAQDVISDILVERLKRYNIIPSLDEDLFSEIQGPHFHSSRSDEFSFPSNCDVLPNQPGAMYTCSKITYNNKFIEKEQASPIFIWGNSYIISPMQQYEPGTFPSLICKKTLSPIDWQFNPGWGVLQEALVQFLSRPDFYIKGKKVAIMAFGTGFLGKANLMPNIRQTDHDRVILNNKKMVSFIQPHSNCNIEISTGDDGFNKLEKKTWFQFDANGKASILLKNENINPSKNSIVLISAVSYKNTISHICVNGEKKIVRSYNTDPSYHSIVFELPPNVVDISVDAYGEANNFLSIKSIQVWQ